jgi:hypothetical protein
MKGLQFFRANLKLARVVYGEISRVQSNQLRELTTKCSLSLALGDIRLLERQWYITHAGLLRLAQRKRCTGIHTTLVEKLCDPVTQRWVFRATVYKCSGSKGFVGYGDADPSNVSSLVHGAEMRVAETRAVNRALRKAYGIGICSVEELGSFSSGFRTEPQSQSNGSRPSPNHSPSDGQLRLRDRLCLLIRQHHLDAGLVKRYAADYCGKTTAAEASREMIEEFISHLADWATKDRDGLVSKLADYARPQREMRA